ncbi:MULTISPECIES: AAA family ATPase [unclassified Moraxella]|uniref:AAA family ATPase n=1 Tax=unclassified Moraxella TaxID=2685852 RepID=UPI003AF632D4
MHLDSLTIKNFRILEDVTIEKLGHVNLIVGKNNSGKSTVLEALALLASGFDLKTVQKLVDNRNVNRHGVLKIESEQTETIQPKFDEKLFLNLLTRGEDSSQNVIDIGSKSFYLQVGYAQNRYIGFLDSSKYINESDNYFTLKNQFPSNDLMIRSSFKLINSGLVTGVSGIDYPPFPKYQFVDTGSINIETLATEWEQIALTNEEDLVVKMLQLIDENIQNIAFLTDTNTNFRVPFVRLKGVENRIPLHSMGDGIFRLLQIIFKVINSRNGFLLIDEFENGLHYSVQPEVWRLIFELAHRFNIQVFATTHSWDTIESFAQIAKERTDMDGVLFRMGHSVRKSDNGKLIATVFDEEKLYHLTKIQMEVR